MSFKIKQVAAAITVVAVGVSGIASAALEEIVVTAQKRSQSMQDVPISISAFSAKELERAGIDSYDSLGLVTPGLQSSRQVGAATPFLRGIGAQSSSVGIESATSMYLDGVYISGTVDGIMTLNNIERIEVLKGPQGTLFGRNTTGGVIHIITKDPTYEPQLNVAFTAGNYETFGSKLYASKGLSDKVAVDLGVVVQRQDGRWGRNRTNGDKTGYEEYTSLRTKLLWEPSDYTSVKLSARWSENDDDIGVVRGCANETFGCIGGTRPLDVIQDAEASTTGNSTRESSALSARIDHSFANVDFVSITSYKDSESVQDFDLDSSPIPLTIAALNQTNETFTQEFQLLSTDDSKAFSWIAGAYYYDDDWAYAPLSVGGLAFGGGAGRVAAFSTALTKSYSVFGEVNFDVSDNTDLTFGLRYTKDEREVVGRTEVDAPNGVTVAILPFREEKSFDEPTYRIVLNHHFNDDVLGYVSYNRGFKAGAFNTVVFTGVVPPPIDPEILDAYEVGMKGDFLDGNLRLNLAAFYYDYANLQLQKIRGGAGALLENAAESKILGFEADGQFAFNDALILRFGLSILDTEYKDYVGCEINTPSPVALGPLGAGNIKTEGVCSGNQLIRAPEFTYNLGLTYDSGNFGGSILLAYNDGFFWEPDNRVKEDSYTIVNAEVSWTSSDDKYSVTLWGKNITDEEYSVYTVEATTGDVAAGAPPATYGVTFEANFY